MLECACNQSAVPERTNIAIVKNSWFRCIVRCMMPTISFFGQNRRTDCVSAWRLRRHFPLVEEALHGKDADDTVDVALSPDDAFGEQDRSWSVL